MRKLSSHSLRKLGLVTAVAFACATTSVNLQAASSSTTFLVSATVLSACIVTTPLILAFGNYAPSNAAGASATTTFNVTCTNGTPFSLGMNAGVGTGATVTARKLTSTLAPAGSNTLVYSLYKDAAHTTNWDNSATGTGYVGAGLLQPFTVYGLINPGQYSAAPAIDYADTITLTLTY